MKDSMKGFPRQIAGGLWVLGNSYFNIYLAKGANAAALMETGISATVDEVAGQLTDLGIQPDYMIVLHPHPDHINGLPGLSAIYPGARIIAGAGAAEFVAHPRTAQSLVAEDSFMSGFLAAEGFPISRPPLESPPSLAGSTVMGEGGRLDLGGLTLEFLSAPGHALGGLAIHIPEIRAIIASDCLGFRFPALADFFPIFFTGYSDYMATIDRLESFRPEILGLAHQGPLTGAEASAAFRQARLSAKRIRDAIALGQGDERALIEEIYGKYYRDEMKMYTRENIETCCKLLIKRSREANGP